CSPLSLWERGVRGVRASEGTPPDSSRPLRQGMVVVTDDAGDLPGAVLLLPEVDELRLADRLLPVPPRMIEAVDADLDRAIAVHGIHLERSGNEHPISLAADVLLDALDQALPRLVGQAAVVVVELQLFREERGELLQIATRS